MPLSALEVKEQARALGFNLAGVAPAQPVPRAGEYLRWVEAGRHGGLTYLARAYHRSARQDLNLVLPGARSLVVVGLDYRAPAPAAAALTDPGRGRIAAYAWGLDYHALMRPRLLELTEWLRARGGGQARAYVDKCALLERGHAQQAGLGFTGKNTLLIHPRRGSDFFLGEVLTDLEFDRYDAPGPETRCGTCLRCLQACPTAAFPEPYVLDARRCISYLTIEHIGWIDPQLRPGMGNWVFGCDVCQEVCPWQRFGVQTLEAAFLTNSADRAAPPLRDLLRLDEAGFEARFHATPLLRTGRARLVRNACVAAGNAGPAYAAELGPLLEQLLSDSDRYVRGHAAWALGRLDRRASLPAALALEDDLQVREEILRAMT